MKRQTAKRLSHHVLLALLFPALILTGTLWGQSALSTIRGTVTDESKSVVPGVEVTVRDINTNIVARTVISDDNGNFEISDLKRGTYRLEAALVGFKTFAADQIILEGTQIRRFDIVLT